LCSDGTNKKGCRYELVLMLISNLNFSHADCEPASCWYGLHLLGNALLAKPANQ
jgi:hypothetical protein